MSEKRFIIVKSIENLYALVDKEREGKEQILIFSLHKEQLGVVCDLLNEQQATIRKLQDLCGESDSENARLRIENKKLKAKLKEKEEDERLDANEIVELRKTNEEWLQFKDLGGDY